MHDDLLQQARMLVTLDTRRPKQVNLRRAVSTAYYALFHFLADQATRNLMGASPSARAFRNVLARALVHADIKAACVSFAGGNLKATVSKGLPGTTAIPAEIRRIADMLVELQGKRHAADYDLSEHFVRADVLMMIEKVHDSIEKFKALDNADVKKFFLSCLLAWRALSSR